MQYFNQCVSVFAAVLSKKVQTQLCDLGTWNRDKKCWSTTGRHLTVAEARALPGPSTNISSNATICMKNCACNDFFIRFFPKLTLEHRLAVWRKQWSRSTWRQLRLMAWKYTLVAIAGLGGGLSGGMLGAFVSVLAAQVWRAGRLVLEQATMLDHVQFGKAFHVTLLVLALLQRLAAIASSSSTTIAQAKHRGLFRKCIQIFCIVVGTISGLGAGVTNCQAWLRRRQRVSLLGEVVEHHSSARNNFWTRSTDCDDDSWWVPHHVAPSTHEKSQLKLSYREGLDELMRAFIGGVVAVYTRLYRRGVNVRVAQRYHIFLTVLTTIVELM